MISKTNKESRYERLFRQAEELLLQSPSMLSKYATLNAILYHKIPYIFWVGFYLIHDNDLVISAYQGPLACQVLHYPKGICWQSINKKSSLIIPDVLKAPNHHACDSRAKSEIVIPIYDKSEKIIGVLDVDSDKLNAFDKTDEKGLKQLLSLL